MSCKYCDEYAEIDATISDERIAKYKAYIEHCVSLDGKPSARLVFTDGCDDWERVISFCPMCGEKLEAEHCEAGPVYVPLSDEEKEILGDMPALRKLFENMGARFE